jgi:hypothetical protein
MGNRRASTLKRKLINNGGCVNEEAVKKYLCEKCQIQYVIIDDDKERTYLEHFAVAILKPEYND